MRRRTLLVVLAGLAVVVAAGEVVVLWPEPTGDAMRVNFHRIATNSVSSQAELLSLLGPPGDYTTGPTNITGMGEMATVPEDYLIGLPAVYWKTDTAEIR